MNFPDREPMPRRAKAAALAAIAAIAGGLPAFVISDHAVPDSPEEVAVAYLAAMADGDVDRAWDLSCGYLRNVYGSREAFVADNERRSKITLGLFGDVPQSWAEFDVRTSDTTVERLSPEEVVVPRRPIEPWRVTYFGRSNVTTLVIREHGELRFCGGSRSL
jgi:hypothetical protein